MMGKSLTLTSNLDIVKELCEELEGFFEAFQMDRVWSTDNSRVTVCFTAEKIKRKPRLSAKMLDYLNPKNKKKKEEPYRY